MQARAALPQSADMSGDAGTVADCGRAKVRFCILALAGRRIMRDVARRAENAETLQRPGTVTLCRIERRLMLLRWYCD
jgi:hypothetical protein